MQSGGGFIIDDLSTVFDDPTPAQIQTDTDEAISNADSVATPKALTSKQEGKLRTFLDGALEDITRGYRKRFDPSSPLHTLSSYLAEWMRLLGVLAHVPPYGSGSTNLLISYLLRCSTDLCDGITGYSLAMGAEAEKRHRKRKQAEQEHGEKPIRNGDLASNQDDNGEEDAESEEDEEEERQHQIASRAKQLNLALQTIDLLDRVWAAVLRGNLVNLPVAVSNARKAFPDSDDAAAETSAGDGLRSHQAYHPRTTHSTSSLVPSPAIDGRFVSGSTSTHNAPKESLPIHGGRGNRTVGVTNQVRLRNIAISSREKLFSWMRTELDAPPPPIMDELDPEREPNDNTVQGLFGIKTESSKATDADAEAEEDAGEDADFEDVAIGGEEEVKQEEGYNAEEDTQEHKHYQDLFGRKLDPDEDDEDEEDGPSAAGRDSDQTLGASVLGTVEAITDETHDKRKREESPDEPAEPQEQPRADGLPSKRPRPAAIPDADTDTDAAASEAGAKMSRSEMGSLNFSLSDAIGQWDIAFTRLFSRTLRTLSDLSEGSKRAGKTNFSTSLAGISGGDELEPADER